MPRAYHAIAIFIFITTSLFSQVSRLHPAGAIFDTVAGVDGLNGAFSIAESPDGKFIYAAAVEDTAVSWFLKDSLTGALSYAGRIRLTAPAWNCRSMVVAVSPDGRNVYASGGFTYSFSRNPTTGNLTDRDSLDWSINNAEGEAIRVAPDGHNVYIVSLGGSEITVYGRDTATGRLSYRMQRYNSSEGVTGLNRCNAVAVSPDSRSVYVVSEDSVLSVWAVDTVSDTIGWVQYFKEGVSGVRGLYYSTDIEVSPDGRSVYAISIANGNAVGWFRRNTVTGMLSFGGSLADSAGELDYPTSLALSPDGKRAYIYLVNKGVISSFLRDSASGALSFESVSSYAYSQPGMIINSHSHIIMSRDNRFLYQAATRCDGIVWYKPNFIPEIDSLSMAGDTLRFAEGDTLALRVFASDADINDSLRFSWKLGASAIPGADTCRHVLGYDSRRSDSLRVFLTDGLDTVSHVWRLLIADTVEPVVELAGAGQPSAANLSVSSGGFPVALMAIPRIPGRESHDVSLVLLDPVGRKVATVLNQRLSAGLYRAAIPSRASGVYFCRMRIGSEVEKNVKFVFVR